MERIVAYQCYAVALACIWYKLGNVAYIVASGKVDVSTLSVLDELAEESSDLEVCVLFELSSINEVEKAVGPIEIGYKWRHGAFLCASKSDFRESLGKTSEIGIDTDHEVAILQARAISYTTLNGVVQKLSSPRAAFSFALEQVIVEDVAVTINKDKDLWQC